MTRSAQRSLIHMDDVPSFKRVCKNGRVLLVEMHCNILIAEGEFGKNTGAMRDLQA